MLRAVGVGDHATVPGEPVDDGHPGGVVPEHQIVEVVVAVHHCPGPAVQASQYLAAMLAQLAPEIVQGIRYLMPRPSCVKGETV